ncbi:g7676 [Coccomyxa elongata]
MVLLGFLAVVCGISLSLIYALSDVRRRTGFKDEEGEVERLQSGETEAVRKPYHAGPAETMMAFWLSLALGTGLLAFLYFAIWHGKGPQPGPKCTPPTWQERIAFFGDLRGFSHPISTTSLDAHKLFDQGMLLAWNFNQYEAFQSFSMARELDPSAAMASWGVAYSLGPGANREVVTESKWFPSFSPDDFPACHEAAQKALSLAQAAVAADTTGSKVLQKELAYAEAQAARFANGTAMQPKRNIAQRRYAQLMESIGNTYKDAHAWALAAEGYMTITQWDYFDEDGQYRPNAESALRLIRRVLEADPQNALAHHLHIHIAETARQTSAANEHSPKIAEGSGVAMTFTEGPWEGKFGHLVHMPGHIFIRVGRWKDAVTANIRAYKADMDYTDRCMVAYGPEHNTDMLIYAANMAGMVEVAEEFGIKLRAYQDVMHPAAYGDSSREWAHLVLTKVIFGKWDDILAIQAVPENARGQCPMGGIHYVRAIVHYARCLALAAKAAGAAARGFAADRERLLGLAVAELDLLKAAEGNVLEEEITVPGEPPGVYGCDYKRLARIAVLHAGARLDLLQGNSAGAVAKLELAKAEEDASPYMEPPRLWQPIRHCLGFVHLNATGDHAAAEKAYREDLVELPRNGWSLLGLAQSLTAQGSPEGREILTGEFAAAWADADIAIDSSCLAFSKY